MAVSCALHKRSGCLGGEHIRGESAHVGQEVELPQVMLVEMAHNRCGVTPCRKQQGRTWGTTRNGASCQENSDPWVLLGQLPFATVQVSLNISQDNPLLHPPTLLCLSHLSGLWILEKNSPS